MPNVGLEITRHIESVWKVYSGVGVLQQIEPGATVGVFIDHRSVADRVAV